MKQVRRKGLPRVPAATVAALMLAALPQAHAQQGRTARIQNLEQVTLQRSGCYGYCPAYRVTVFADGRVEYEGMADVKVLGFRSATLGAAELRKLKDELNKAGFLGLRDSYDSSEAGCTAVATDSPSVKLSARTDGMLKSVDHYLGCLGPVSDRLASLENAIDRIAGTQQWIGAPGERRHQPSAADKSRRVAISPEFERGHTDRELLSTYRRSARGGDCGAAIRLGEIYDKGFRGIARDYAESLQWYDRAQMLGCRIPLKK